MARAIPRAPTGMGMVSLAAKGENLTTHRALENPDPLLHRKFMVSMVHIGGGGDLNFHLK